ncbi:MAG: class I SAM-dependent methyltransferase [Sedimentisphaerales bacterium]|nr:class I SAM-dependent methyltransferase [Sedimentisphaerales bacterium]
MELTEILRCPRTGNKLRFDDCDKIVHVADSDMEYPVVDGIIDFCHGASDKVSRAYDKVADRYDTLLSKPKVPHRIINTLVWGIGDDRPYIETVLSYLPNQFDGILLDVPVGTGIFTSPIYTRYPKATIIGIDLSMSMLRKSRECFERDGLRKVVLLKADVNNLPLRNDVVDLILSMNGWHAFTDKQRAIAEIRRVLCTQGTLIACGYVKGTRKISDWFVKHFGVPRGFFNPPFFELDDVPSQFKGFTVIRQANVQSMAYFEAIKEE